MAKASDNPFPSVLVVEGTTPSSPAAGDQRLFVDSSDHKLKRVNSSGAVTTIEGGGSVLAIASGSRTSGDITVSGTGVDSYTAFDTGTDLLVAAAAGDRIELTLEVIASARSTGSFGNNINFTAKTIVSAAAVNNIAGTGTAAVTAWFAPDALWTVDGSTLYTVQAGDLSGGNVTLRLYYRADLTNEARTLFANATNPMRWRAKNFLH